MWNQTVQNTKITFAGRLCSATSIQVVQSVKKGLSPAGSAALGSAGHPESPPYVQCPQSDGNKAKHDGSNDYAGNVESSSKLKAERDRARVSPSRGWSQSTPGVPPSSTPNFPPAFPPPPLPRSVSPALPGAVGIAGVETAALQLPRVNPATFSLPLLAPPGIAQPGSLSLSRGTLAFSPPPQGFVSQHEGTKAFSLSHVKPWTEGL
ncbi:PREDICTED: wiskott-Aldrich syndrome protein family member 2-like [Lepidothrix coronata]|uniref:Wiskott-Aldrich syndrome protein family member 2-like n=1 Tax=Lepidothrix coronata TaxID=321398 RepID=A0A6J0J575_9PASS|nr:PREDICTED: wiskott-Aldrich syndrome protein family member 2-like [Lepidothrix coronata]